jgi:hypothetical protein
VYKIIIILIIFAIFLQSQNEAEGQEPKPSTFREVAQVFIDKQFSNNVTASITLQSSSNQEIRIPTELLKNIRDSERVLAVIITNEEQCVLGVSIDEACVMINFSGEGVEGEEGIIFAIQDLGKEIGESLIGNINEAFKINTDFHSVYVHHRDELTLALNTSGVISGKGTVSIVYTMPKEDTYSMYEKFSAILIPKNIRDAGGFYDVAKNLSIDDDSQMTVSIIPQDDITLLQLKLSIDYPNEASKVDDVSPLEYLKVNNLERSDYFSDDFYPLNSLLNVVVLSSEPIKVNSVNTKLVPIIQSGNETIPDVRNDGWFFIHEKGNMIDGMYLFGKKSSVSKNDLVFTLSSLNDTGSVKNGSSIEIRDTDYTQILVLIGIVIAGAGAIIYFFKGFKTKS